jgi:hypothetical protein
MEASKSKVANGRGTTTHHLLFLMNSHDTNGNPTTQSQSTDQGIILSLTSVKMKTVVELISVYLCLFVVKKMVEWLRVLRAFVVITPA